MDSETTTVDPRDGFVKKLEEMDRNWSWFHREVKKKALELEKPDCVMAYSRMWAILKKYDELPDSHRKFWNKVLKTKI